MGVLRAEHEMRELYVRRQSLLHLVVDTVRGIRGVLWADMVFAWFGGYHALLPFILGRLLRRKCVVIASGYDVAAMPEIGYGNMRPGIRRTIGLWVFRLAHKVLAVSQFTTQQAVHNAQVSPGKLQVIYHGIKVPVVRDVHNLSEQRRGVLMVSTVKRENLSRKGLPTFVKAASYLRDVPFTLVGPWIDDAIDSLRAIASPNIEFTGWLSNDDLVRRMKTVSVYVQVSAYEAFGMAVAEAMLGGCIPVTTDRGALPEVAGDNGFFVPYEDVQATVEAIRQALAADPEARERCRQHIIDTFPLERRKEQLLQAIREL